MTDTGIDRWLESLPMWFWAVVCSVALSAGMFAVAWGFWQKLVECAQ